MADLDIHVSNERCKPPLLLLRFKKNDDERWKELSGYFSKSVSYSSIYARVFGEYDLAFLIFCQKHEIQIMIFLCGHVYIFIGLMKIYYIHFVIFSLLLIGPIILACHIYNAVFGNYTFKSLFASSALLAAVLSNFFALSSPPIATASSLETFSVSPNVSTASSAGHNASVTPELGATSLLFRDLIAFSFG